MHVALQNGDILDEILEHLIPSSGYSAGHYCDCKSNEEAQKTLHSAALTCKAFSEPALQRMWTHISTLDCLLALLPSSAKLVKCDPPPEAPQNEDTIWVGSLYCTSSLQS